MTVSAHYALCLFAERATGIPEIDGARVQLIELPRGTGKSAIVTAGRSVQRLLQNPAWTVGIANETQRMANTFLSGIAAAFEGNAMIQALFPECIPENFRDTTWRGDEIVIRRPQFDPAPSVRAIGVGGTVTGSHLHEWIVDDMISKNAADNARKGSFTETEDAIHWVVQLPPLLRKPTDDPLTFVFTPWFIGDPYHFVERFFGKVPEGMELEEHQKDFETIWRLRLPDGEVQHIPLYRRGDVAVFKRPALINGRSAYPLLWSTEKLSEMAVQPENADFFQANYMLEPAGGAAAMFKLDWIKPYEIDGKAIRYVGQDGRIQYHLMRDLIYFISVDPAFSDKHSAARTAIPVTATDGTNIFLMEDFAERINSVDDIANKVCDFALRYPRTQEIVVETIVAQIAVADAIRRIAADRAIKLPPIREIPTHGNQRKEFRIYALEPWFKKGQFFAHASHHNFRREYSTFPKAQLRDILDALSFQLDSWERIASGRARGSANSVEAIERAQIARLRSAAR